MQLFDGLNDMAVADWLILNPWMWVLLSLFLGWLLSWPLWQLVVFVPQSLQAGWREAAQQELGLAVEPAEKSIVLWRRAGVALPQNQAHRYVLGLLTPLLLGLVAWRYGVTGMTLWGGLLSLLLLVLALIDARTRLLPDVLTLSCLWLGLLSHVVMADMEMLRAGVLGAAMGYSVLWLVAKLFKSITGQDGMGYGDFKLFAALGAWLGWTSLPWVLFVAASLGVLWAMVSGRLKHTTFPFGPCLAIAGWLLLLWGQPLIYG